MEGRIKKRLRFTVEQIIGSLKEAERPVDTHSSKCAGSNDVSALRLKSRQQTTFLAGVEFGRRRVFQKTHLVIVRQVSNEVAASSPIQTTRAPVLPSCSFRRLPRTSPHRRSMMSPRRHPVSRISVIAVAAGDRTGSSPAHFSAKTFPTCASSRVEKALVLALWVKKTWHGFVSPACSSMPQPGQDAVEDQRPAATREDRAEMYIYLIKLHLTRTIDF